jgi:hypothetical protein
MKTVRILASASVAIAILAACVGTSAAGRLSVTSSTFRVGLARWTFSGGFGTVECPLTLEGSLHSRTIAKTAGSLIGYITRATLGTCARGSATILTVSLPWHVRYGTFSGTLPAITRIFTTFTGARFQIREPVVSITCLASGGTNSVAYNRESGGVLTSAEIGGETPTNCEIPGVLSGISNTLTVLGAETRIIVTLI